MQSDLSLSNSMSIGHRRNILPSTCSRCQGHSTTQQVSKTLRRDHSYLPPEVFLTQTHPSVAMRKYLQLEHISCIYYFFSTSGQYIAIQHIEPQMHQSIDEKTVSSLQLHQQKLFECGKERNWQRRKMRQCRALFPSTGLYEAMSTR